MARMQTLPDYCRATRAFWLLCALTLVYLLALEIGTRVLYPTHSALAALTEAFGYARGELLDHPVEMLVPERFRARHPELRNGFS